MQRSERVINSERAFVVALGVEDMVRELLLRDLRGEEGGGNDYYVRRFDRDGDGYNDIQSEKWSLPFTFTNSPVKGMDVRWCVHDLNGFIDLNLLASSDEQTRDYTKKAVLALIEILFKKKEEDSYLLQSTSPDEVVDDEDTLALEELITSHGIDIDTYALRAANALMDWFDEDNDVREPGGAEVDDYLYDEQKYPYLPANGMRMAWPDEVRLIKGYHERNYYLSENILPYVTAIPVEHEAIRSQDSEGKEAENYRLAININTAPTQVLKAIIRSRGEIGRGLGAAIDETVASKLYPPWPSLPPSYYRFTDVNDFCRRIGLLNRGDKGNKECKTLENFFFTTHSKYFQLDVELKLGSTGSWLMQSLFHRQGDDDNEKDVFVLQRSMNRSSYHRNTNLYRWRRCH